MIIVVEVLLEIVYVFVICYVLVYLEDDLVGDFLEKAILKVVEWNFIKGKKVVLEYRKKVFVN